MTDPVRKPEGAALQFMIVDFLSEILKFSANPTEMAQHLARLLRELMGVRTVLMVQHDPEVSEGSAGVVAVEPRRAPISRRLPDLMKLLRLQLASKNTTFLQRATTLPEIAAVLDLLEVAQLSLQPLSIGDLRVGTLFVLDYVDQEHLDESHALLDALAPVFALILRNTVHYESQEARVVAQAEEYRTLLQTNLDGYWAVSGQGSILDANGAYLNMSGYSLEELTCLSISQLEATESVEEIAARVEKIKQIGSDRFLSKHRRKDGSLFPVEISTTYVPDRDGYITFIRDLSTLKQAEAEAAKLQVQLQQSQKMESLGVLASGMAHDMNNVLAAILGVSSTIQAQLPASHPMAAAVESITKACLRGRDVVRSLLLFARQDLVKEEPVDLNQLVEETIELLVHTTLKRVRLEMELQPDLPRVSADRSALTHALINLCVNAVDAMPEGGVLTLATRQEADQGITLSVRDTGQGMSTEVLSKALDPFFTTKPVGKGTGLGLPMVYGTMQAHDGTLDLHSEVGQGTEVAMRFPASRLLPASAVAAPAEPPPAKGIRRRVLIVDDDEMVLESLAMLLDLLGHEVSKATGGSAALRWLESGEAADLVILDMNMPGMTGAETLPRLRALRPDLPVLLATGLLDEGLLDLEKRSRGVKLIGKPFDVNDLRNALETLFHPGRALPGPASIPELQSVLLVDDDEDVRFLTSRMLRHAGLKVSTAAGGEEALEQLRSQPVPDLVVLDLTMPGMDGLATLERLREFQRDVPVLISSGRVDIQDWSCFQRPDVRFLPKPFTLPELQAAFRELASRSEGGPNA